MNALEIINKDIIKNFSKDEFPDGALEKTDAVVLETLQELRDEWDRNIFPSTHPLGWARLDDKYKYSFHYAVNRNSLAGDIFPAGNVYQFWLMMQGLPQIGECGIYFDTNRFSKQPGPMIHFSVSDKRRLFCRVNKKYYKLDDRGTLNDFRVFNKSVDEYLNKELK